MHRIRNGFLALAATASMLLGTSIVVTPATASELTFNFVGVVLLRDASLASTFTAPLPMSGFIKYLDTTTDSNPGDATIGQYNNAITGGGININGGAYVVNLLPGPSANNFITIENQANSPGNQDSYQMRVSTDNTPTAGAFVPNYFQVDLLHLPSTFLDDTLQPPTLGGINSVNTFRMSFLNGSTIAELSGKITNASVVPLPPAVILFGAGLVALIGLGARNWQRTAGARLQA